MGRLDMLGPVQRCHDLRQLNGLDVPVSLGKIRRNNVRSGPNHLPELHIQSIRAIPSACSRALGFCKCKAPCCSGNGPTST
jgi:hypothetical protein